jgi:SAM-dependent methyltransferase
MPVPRQKKAERKKMMPKYWARTFRPEEERNPAKFNLEERGVKTMKRTDQEIHWVMRSSGIKEVQNFLNHSINFEIKERLKAKKKVFVLDLGCGSGRTLNDIKQLFGNRVHTTGQVLQKPKFNKESYTGVDRLLEGELRNIKPKNTFDIIYSHFGATAYTELKATAVEKIVQWLKPGGIAVLDFGGVGSSILTGLYNKELLTILRQNGITPKKIKKTLILRRIKKIVFEKPVPKIPS